MTARISLSESLLDLDDAEQKKRVGALLKKCPDHIMERIRVMFTDDQLMGTELSHQAELFAHLSQETSRVYKKEGESERFLELSEIHLKTLEIFSKNILVLDDDPLLYVFFEALILQAFRTPGQNHAHKT